MTPNSRRLRLMVCDCILMVTSFIARTHPGMWTVNVQRWGIKKMQPARA
jgi:hypothetical protein